MTWVLALLGKWLCRVLVGEDSLWRKVIIIRSGWRKAGCGLKFVPPVWRSGVRATPTGFDEFVRHILWQVDNARKVVFGKTKTSGVGRRSLGSVFRTC